MQIRHAFFVVLVCLGALVSVTWGQDGEAPTREELVALLEAAGDTVGATGEPPNETAAALRAALAALERAEASRARAAGLLADAQTVPLRGEQYRAKVADEPETNPAIEVPSGATLAELETARDQAAANLEAARAEALAVEQDAATWQQRLAVLPGLIEQARAEVARLGEELATPAAAEVAPELAAARRARTRAALESAEAKLAELQAERARYAAGLEIVDDRLAAERRDVVEAEALLRAWNRVVSARRERETREAVQRAREVDLGAALEIPALERVAEQVQRLIRDLQGTGAVPAQLEDARDDLDRIRTRLAERVRQGQEIHELARGRGAGGYGQLLQSTLSELQDARAVERRLDEAREALVDAELRLRELRALPTDTGMALQEVRKQLGDADEETVALAERVVEQRRLLARQALDAYTKYTEVLRSLDAGYVEYLEVTAELREFIEPLVFWARSVPRDALVPGARDFLYDVRWLTDGEQWRAALGATAWELVAPEALDAGTGERGWRLAVFPVGSTLLLALAWAVHWRFKIRSRAPLPTTGRLQQMTMPGVAWKLAMAVAAAAPAPLALWLIAAWLGSTAGAFDPEQHEPMPAPLAVASGLTRVAYVLFGAGLLWEIVRKGAVGTNQFRWSEAGLAHLRRHLRWLIPLGLVLAAVIQTFMQRSDPRHPEVVGRASLVVGLVAFAAFHALVFSPRRPFITEYLKKHRRGIVERTAWGWYPLMVLVPLALAVGASAGYVYTALEIQRSIGNTYLFVLLVIVGQAVALRWLQLARRKIAIRAAQARAAAAEQPESARKPDDAAAPPKEPEQREVDLTAISQQSRKVVQVLTVVVLTLGLYAVWNDVLPALRWFERVQVFPSIRYVDPESVAAESVVPAPGAAAERTAGGTTPSLSPTGLTGSLAGEAGAAADEVAALPARVTVADIGLALLLIIATVSASRNLPGLLEITLLPRLPLNAAGRYAAYSVARYTIIIVGVIAISRALSIPWESAQWLAAALTFGLAFGLQEIFANFVSGLIILFEQPVRVGDTVTVADVSGTVSKIRMRATTVVDWDNKELIIPNKEFITGQVINWTLTDPSCRIIVPVGIAYGSNTELARELLLKVAAETPNTLREPAPRALFLGFGDNSLAFDLRVYIKGIDYLLATKSELHFRIDRAFREAGIEISFPQRDLHLRSIDPSIIERLKPSPERGTRADGES